MEEILTPEQVASLLQIHRRTVYKLAREGSIPGTKFGGVWRFSKDAILKMVARNGKQYKKLRQELNTRKEIPLQADEVVK